MTRLINHHAESLALRLRVEIKKLLEQGKRPDFEMLYKFMRDGLADYEAAADRIQERLYGPRKRED